METLNKLSIKELYELIELYKKATIDGEKTELSVTYPFENGVYDYSKRIVTLSLIGGYSRDRDSFIVDSSDFDKYILPNMVELFSSDDSLTNWDVEYVETSGIYKGVNETVSGDVLYIEDKESKYDSLKDDAVLEKENFTNNDKVWNEIINYSRERRKFKDYYSSSNFTHREIGAICNFVEKLSNDNKINIGNSKKNKENNINYISELFKDKDKILDLGLSEELYEKIANTDTVRQLAIFTGYEKRLRNRVDVDSPVIKDRIRFAVDELDKVDYFDLKNASLKSFKDKNFLTSKPLAIIKLKHICESKLYDYETSMNYKKYCDEILYFLERNAKKSRKDLLSKVEKNIEFEKDRDVSVDKYDELWDAISLVVGARVNDERYEIVIEDNKNNGNKIVRISLISGIVKTDTFIFEFTNHEKLNEEMKKIQDSIAKSDLSFESVIRYSDDKKLVLDRTVSGNEVLNKMQINNLSINNDFVKLSDNTNKKENFKYKNNIIDKLNEIKNDINKLDKETKEEKIEKINDNHKTKLEEITMDDLNRIENFFSDYLLEKEQKEKENKYVDIPFMNLSIATFELLIDKYKDNLFDLYQNGQLPDDEKDVIDNIKFLKNKLEIYYNENVERSASLIEEEMKRLANCEVALATVYRLESSYDIEKNYQNTPSGSLLKKVYQDEYDKNEKYTDEMVDKYINKYRVILQKYNNDNVKYDEKELAGDKDTLLQVITYKMKLKDVYDNIINKEKLSKNDLSTLAKYERILYEMYEIDSKYQENIENKIKELKNQEQFLTPSSKIYLASLEKENNNTINKKVDEEPKSEYLFEIIKNDDLEEKKENSDSEEIRKAYYNALEKSDNESPLSINILFDRNDKNKAELTISNFNKEEEYKKVIDGEKIKELIPLLCELFNQNNLEYAFKYNTATSDDMCLLGFTDDKKKFKIMYADNDLVDYAKDLLENGQKKEEGMKK